MVKPNPEAVERLLAAAQRLMLAQGFAGTTIDQVCAEAGVTKGALFHYFRSKDALIEATLERFLRNGAAAYADAPFLREADPWRRLEGYVDYTASLFRNPVEDACLIGMCSAELADSRPVLRGRCNEAFAQWAAGLGVMLEQVRRHYAPRVRVDTRDLAQHFVAVFEGAVLLAKAQDDVAPMRSSLEHFKRYVRAILVDGAPARAPRRAGRPRPARPQR